MKGAPCRDEVIVLRSLKLGESSRIVSCLALGHGHIKLVARGVSGPRGRWGGLLECGNELEAVFYARPDRELWTLAEAGLLRAALTGGGSLDKLSYLLAVLELADRLLPEREPVRTIAAIYRRYLDRWHHEGPTAMPALFFALEMALLKELGLSIELSRCGDCGRVLQADEGALFRPAEGNLVCRSCSRGKGVRVGAGDLATWRTLEGFLEIGEIPRLDEEPRRRIGKLIHLQMMHHLPRYRIPGSLYWLRTADGTEGDQS